MLDDLIGIVESLIRKGSDEPSVHFLTGGTPAERIASLRALLGHIDEELSQLIVEALFEALTAVSADVGALLQVQDHDLYTMFSTDPSLLEGCMKWKGDVHQLNHKLQANVLNTFRVKDAICRTLRCGERDWVLMLGERAGKLDREAFLANEEAIGDIFTRLLQRREASFNARPSLDHVTGLPDRWATMVSIGEAIMSSKRDNSQAAVLFVDLNDFKLVNDALGHAHGDSVLKSLAARMRGALRAREFVGRIGGDEFAVVLPSIKGVEDAEYVAQRLHKAVAEFDASETPGSVSLSIGIALYPDHAANQEEWLHHADMAMYRAKRLRHPYAVYDPAWSNEKANVTDLFENDATFEQQFLLCFQPIFHVQTGTVAAVESLVRWLHPQDGVLSASSAMDAAQRWQTSRNLDLWVIRRALRYAAAWRERGIERVHVNIAAVDPETLLGLTDVITASDVDPSLLAIELGGDVPEHGQDAYRRLVESLSATGATVGIDGFGTGNLNLPFLETLPIRFVKVSNALLPSNHGSTKGIAAAVAVANALEWDVIATRVATAEDRYAIREAGIKYMQGFACAQPMTAIDFEQWVDQRPRLASVK